MNTHGTLHTPQRQEPAYYEILYRPPEGGRWKKAGRATTEAEALTLIGGPGDWHLKAIYVDDAGPGLFDDVADEPK